jgi:uncharacterized phage protein gp47/JayE
MWAQQSLDDLVKIARQAFRSNLKGSDATVWPNNVYVTAKVIGGIAFMILGFASYISRQKFAYSAPDIESLKEHGEEFGIPQKPAAPARGSITFSGGGPLTISNGAVVQRIDGIQYTIPLGASQAGAGTLTLDAVALTNGIGTNAEAGTPLAIVSGVSDAAATAEVASGGMILGAEVEDIESYRARILFRKRNPIMGGAPADYVTWAGEVPGVTRVFVERRYAGSGTVRVFVLMDDTYAGGIPTSSDVDRVADYLEALQPADATVSVAAPAAKTIDITIADVEPNSVAVREAILAELRATFRRLSRVAGIDQQHPAMPYLAYPTSFSRSWISQAIANATGEDRHRLVAPADDVSLATAQIPILGTVTFI